MSNTDWSFAFALLALVISIWSRLETFYFNRNQRKLEQAKRVGEALVNAQILKNTLSNNIEVSETFLNKMAKSNDSKILYSEVFEGLGKLRNEYEQIWEFVKSLEIIVGAFEKGEKPQLTASAIEAKIAHFKQRRELSLFDIEYLRNKIDSSFSNK